MKCNQPYKLFGNKAFTERAAKIETAAKIPNIHRNHSVGRQSYWNKSMSDDYINILKSFCLVPFA